MNKILLAILLYFSSIFPLFSDSFNNLYEDLLNFWRIGRHSVFIGVQTERVGASYTGNILDFYIDGYGFFVVVDETNERRYLTRNGQFTYDYWGFLRNTDGYFVLNQDNEYINKCDINFDIKIFRDLFLVANPKDISDVVVSSKYIITSEYITTIGIGVRNQLLDSVPFSLGMLLEKAVLEIPKNKHFNNKAGLIVLIYKRYNEMVESGVLTPETRGKLLLAIQMFEQKLKNGE